jgi:hypothetical protein
VSYKEIPLRGEDGHLLTAEEFQQMTGARYIKNIIVSKRALHERRREFWSLLYGLKIDEHSPIVDGYSLEHILKKSTHNDKGEALRRSPGLGVFAEKDFSRGDIVGEYLGKVVSSKEIGTNYRFESIDAKEYGNEISRINDGFPNVVVVTLFTNNLARLIFVAAEKITKGSEFCFNYGPGHSVKDGPYQELRPQALRTFLKKHQDLQTLLSNSLPKVRSCKASLKELCLFERVRYIMNTPSVFFSLILKRAIKEQDSRSLARLACKYDLVTRHYASTNPPVNEIAIIASVCLKCKESNPEIKSLLSELQSRIASEGIEKIMPLLEEIKNIIINKDSCQQ